MNVISQYPLWYFIFCFLLGGLLAFLLYRKDKKLVEFSQTSIGVLFTLRFLGVSIIAILLLSPLIKYFNKVVEKPVIIIAQDNSASMIMGKDSSFVKEGLEKQINKLEKDLASNFELAKFKFDERAEAFDTATLVFDGKLSNYDALIEELESRFTNKNIGGLVLISDGIYNRGSNPSFSIEKLGYPVFTVATGDTSTYLDLKIANLRNNKIAFLGNEFPVEFDLQTQEVKNATAEITISRGGKVIFKKEIAVDKQEELSRVRAILKADKVGKQRYTVQVKALAEERNLLNNKRDFYIDVIDGRQKIALLGVAPHPDLAAIKKSIRKNENYLVESTLLDDFEQSYNEFDLIILHQATMATNRPLDSKVQAILKSKLPILLIGGGWQNIELQFGLKSKRRNNRSLTNEALAKVNEDFTLFTIEESLRKQIAQFPPLTVPSATTTAPENLTLLNQQLGNVETPYSLLSFYEKNGTKLGRLMGEGIWKWSIADYVENKNHKTVDQLLGKVVQYLAIKSDRSLFRVTAANDFFENEDVVFEAQSFNPSYELINDEETELKLIDEEGKEFDYVFNRTNNAYQLSISSLQPGVYNYTATTKLEGQQKVSKGVFTIKKLELEQLESVANHNLLFQLAKKTGGKLFYPESLSQLNKLLLEREDISAVSYLNEEVEEIINLKWIFFILLFLFSLEWFIRKRGGAY